MAVYRDVEVTVYQRKPNSEEMKGIKSTYTVVFDDDSTRSEEQQVEDFLLRVYKWKKGLQYDYLKVKTIKTHNNMAKKESKTEELALFESQAKKIILPEIPEVMEIGGLNFSEKEIQKAVDEIKKVTVEVPLETDTVKVAEEKKKVYESLLEKKSQFVKTRTQPNNFRDAVMKPINAWSRSFKAQIDKYGAIAKEGQDHCESQIFVWENWQEEQDRLEKERIQKIVDKRRAELQAAGGTVNIESLHWTFDHTPSKIVENSSLEEMDDSEWNGLLKELEEAFEADKAKKEKEKEEFEAAKTAVYNARLQMLQLAGGYESKDGSFFKNGHKLTEDQIKNTPEADWFPLVMSHNQAVVNPFSTTESTVKEEPAEEAPVSSNPFAKFVNAAATPPAENVDGPVLDQEPTADHVTTSWELHSFVEKELAKTKLRIFPSANQAKAMEGVHNIKFEGTFDNDLMFIIYA